MFIKNNKKPFSKGFTLIEILVVITIISIVTGVVLVTFSPKSSQKQTAPETLLQLLIDTQNSAIDTNGIFGVHIIEDKLIITSYEKPEYPNSSAYASLSVWQPTQEMTIDIDLAVDFQNELHWQDFPEVNAKDIFISVDTDKEVRMQLPNMLILPTGQVIPSAVLEIKADYGKSNTIEIQWKNSEFTLIDKSI